MTADDQAQMISRLAAIVAAKPEIRFAYLFGSMARRTAGKFSDLDIAVFLDPSYLISETGYGYQSELAPAIKAELAREIDVVILNQASIVLKFQVLKNGVLIYCRSDAERRSFHENTIKIYLDIKPLLKIQSDYLRKRIEAGTFGGGNVG